MKHAMTALLCVLLWADSYAAPHVGPEAREEVKVEICTVAFEPRVVVSRRVYWELREGRTVAEQEIAPWDEVANWRLHVVAGERIK